VSTDRAGTAKSARAVPALVYWLGADGVIGIEVQSALPGEHLHDTDTLGGQIVQELSVRRWFGVWQLLLVQGASGGLV